MGWLTSTYLWEPYEASAQVVGGFASGIGILLGGISLLMIWLQTSHSAKVARQMTAIDAHKDYIKLCLEFPELSSSVMMMRHLKVKNFNHILEMNRCDTEQALWFLSYVLFAMEQLVVSNMRIGKLDSEWKHTVVDQLAYHHLLLQEVWPIWERHYTPKMKTLVEEALAQPIL